MMAKRAVTHGPTGFYRNPRHTTCNTVSVIYLLECNLCLNRNRYVGQTQRQLKLRMDGHRAQQRTKEMPLYRHLKKPGHSFECLRLTILEKVPDITQLIPRESEWMDRLKTRIPTGLNSRFNT